MFDRVLDTPFDSVAVTRYSWESEEDFAIRKAKQDEAREYVAAVCKKIRGLALHTVEDYIQIGFALADLKTRGECDRNIAYQFFIRKDNFSSQDFYDFIETQFGFKKSMTCVLIQVAQKFGERGCVLAEKYRKFTWSQLQEMVSCSDDLLEKITPEMAMREIRVLKKSFVQAPGQESLPADSPAEDTPSIEEQAFSFGGVEYFLSKMGKPDIINLLLQVDRQRQIFEQLLQMYKDRFKVTLKLPKKKGEPEEFDGSIAAVS